MTISDELMNARWCRDVFFECRVVRRHVSRWRMFGWLEAILWAATFVGIVIWLHDFLNGKLQDAAGALVFRLTDFRVVCLVIDARRWIGWRRWHRGDIQILWVWTNCMHGIAVGGLHCWTVGNLRIQRQIGCDATHLHAAGTLREWDVKNNKLVKIGTSTNTR